MVRILRPFPVETRLKLLVFDLDGTLIDSAQDLCNSVNATLATLGASRWRMRPSPASSATARWCWCAAPLRPRADGGRGAAGPGLRLFLDYYREHKLDFTYAYEGVLEALAALKQLHDRRAGRRRAMAVLTNKPVRPARDICAALGLAPYFLNIYGGNSFRDQEARSGGVAGADERGRRTEPEETVMIGDSQVDVETARNAGAWCIGCTFGLAPESLSEIRRM
jgi:phosphoglycolate phosphatase